MRTVRKLLLAVNGLLIACTLLAFVAPLVDPATSAIPAVLALFFPYLLAANVTFVIGWAVVKRYYLLFSLAVIVLGWKHLGSFYQLKGPKGVGEHTSIRIASYNAHQFLAWEDSEAFAKRMLSFVPGQLDNPDIILFQESGWARKFPESLDYPYHHWNLGCWNLVLSKYPIKDMGQLSDKGADKLNWWIDVDIAGTVVRLYLLHLHSNKMTAESENLLESGDFAQRETWEQGAQLVRRYMRAVKSRSSQAQRLREHMNASPYPIIVAGDFNDVPLSYSYATIAADMQDSFVSAGQGVGTTYAGRIPLLRIDYVLADRNFEILNHQIKHLEHSDHYPVIVDLRINDL